MSSDTLDRFRPRPTLQRAVYTVQEVADMLGLALCGTYTLIREGTIPALKVGGRWVVPKSRFHAVARRHRGPDRRARRKRT